MRRARTAGEALAAVTVAIPSPPTHPRATVDPSALVVASRRPGEPWFCFEQPDRDGAALAGLGCVREIEASGRGRFRGGRARLARARRCCDLRPARRPVRRGARGGRRLRVRAATAARRPQWEGFAPASLHVPEVAVARARRRGAADRRGARDARRRRRTLLARIDARLAGLRAGVPLPLLDPAPDRALPRRLDDAARALRGRGRARGRADPRRRAGEGRARARGAGPRAAATTTRRAVLGVAARGVPAPAYVYGVGRGDASVRRRDAGAAGAPRRRCAPRPSRSPARRAAAPTRPSTTTSASSCCAATRTARSRRSSRAASRARCARTPSG